MTSRSLSLLVVGLFAPIAQAATPSSVELMTTAGSLIFVLAIILLLAWLMKRMKLPALGNQQGLKIVRQLSIGTKERIVIVQAGEEQFLVGITAQSINLISKLDKPIDDEAKLSADSTSKSPFSNQLSQLLSKHDK